MADSRLRLIRSALLTRVQGISIADGYSCDISETGAYLKHLQFVTAPAALVYMTAEMPRSKVGARGPSSREARARVGIRLYAADVLNLAADVARAVEADPASLSLLDGQGDAYVNEVEVVGMEEVSTEVEIIGPIGQADLFVEVRYRMDRREL